MNSDFEEDVCDVPNMGMPEECDPWPDDTDDSTDNDLGDALDHIVDRSEDRRKPHQAPKVLF